MLPRGISKLVCIDCHPWQDIETILRDPRAFGETIAITVDEEPADRSTMTDRAFAHRLNGLTSDELAVLCTGNLRHTAIVHLAGLDARYLLLQQNHDGTLESINLIQGHTCKTLWKNGDFTAKTAAA